MSAALRLLVAAVLAGLAGLCVASGQEWIALAGSFAGLLAVLLQGGWSRRLAATLLPLLGFLILLALLQLAGGQRNPVLWTKTAAVYLLLIGAARQFPGRWVLQRVWIHERWQGLALFFILLQHFVVVFGDEARRALVAWRLATPRVVGPGGFSSLVWALANIFRRVLSRAERLYIAQRIRGLD